MNFLAASVLPDCCEAQVTMEVTLSAAKGREESKQPS